MTKKTFLKLLEKKLAILSDDERKDIVDEYSSIIDEKIKHGKTEKEAVKDFDDIDELIAEILKAYKINPNYEKKAASDTETIMNNIEEWISRVATKLADTTKNIYASFKEQNGEMSIQIIFEMIIKMIILLFGIALLRLPFEMLSSLGNEVFSLFFSPFGIVLTFIWRFLMGTIYFIVCIFIFILVFKKYFPNKEETKKSHIKEVKKNNSVETKKEVKKTNDNLLKTIWKIFVVIFFLIPIWCINFSLVMTIVLLLYLLWKGIAVLGILLIVIGLSFLFGFLADVISKLTYNNQKIGFSSFIISGILIMIGSLIMIENTIDFTYKNAINNKITKEITYKETIDNNTKILINDDTTIDFIISDELEDNEITIEIKYTKFVNVNKAHEDKNILINIEKKVNRKEIFNLVIEDLKDKEIYNYGKLFDTKIKVFANSDTLNKLK